MSIEAMKLALEALERDWDGCVNSAKGEAITALRRAIEQAEQKPCLKGGQCKHGSWCSEVYCQEHCEFVEQAEQAEPAPMSQPNRLIAYSAADKLRSLGYQWDEKTAAWQAEQAQLVQRAEDAFERYEAKSDKCLMENAQGDLERVTLVQTGVGIGKAKFTTHAVENAYDWSEWVCPDPAGYLMKCCDCGLVHEAEFRVVRYKSETEREDCEPVDDPNVQAVFRMRRSEQWSPIDTAHRAGGLPMEQAEQAPPVAWATREDFYRELDRSIRRVRKEMEVKSVTMRCKDYDLALPIIDMHFGHVVVGQVTAPPPRQPLTDEQISDLWCKVSNTDFVTADTHEFARAIESAHGIKGEA